MCSFVAEDLASRSVKIQIVDVRDLSSMRGEIPKQPSMIMLVNPSERIPKDHPIRAIKELCDAALAKLSPDFDKMYSQVGRPSIPPERLLKASLLMAFYSTRSERQFCEQLNYNLLFRWFLDMDMDDPCFDPTTFTHNRQRLIDHDIGKKFLCATYEHAKAMGLVSEDHFSVDGTLIEAWASMKSFRPKDEEKDDDSHRGDDDGTRGSDSNPFMNFKDQKRSNETHESKTDPEAKLAKKTGGDKAKLAFAAHALMENRNGLLRDLRITAAAGTTETDAALGMIRDLNRRRRITVAADKNYDNKQFVGECRKMNVTPHVAMWKETKKRKTNLDKRTTNHWGYATSQRIRKRIEEIFGWTKTVGNFKKTRFKGIIKTQLAAYFLGAAYNLTRLAKFLPA